MNFMMVKEEMRVRRVKKAKGEKRGQKGRGDKRGLQVFKEKKEISGQVDQKVKKVTRVI